MSYKSLSQIKHEVIKAYSNGAVVVRLYEFDRGFLNELLYTDNIVVVDGKKMLATQAQMGGSVNSNSLKYVDVEFEPVKMWPRVKTKEMDAKEL